MKDRVCKSITSRLEDEISNSNPLKYLKQYDVETYIDQVLSVVYLYTRPKKGVSNSMIYLVEIISAIGHSVRGRLKLKKDSALAARTGAFILYTFEELGLIEVGLSFGANGHNQYIVKVLQDEPICTLWESVKSSRGTRLPSSKPYAPWISVKHETGVNMIKTFCKEVLDIVTPETHPILFHNLNVSQMTGWRINNDVYKVCGWALRYKTNAFADIWESQNPEAKRTKMREAKTIIDIAKRFINKEFYHLYYYDFRGRKYCSTAYLHEQGTDLAKGLLLRVDKKPLGKEGFFWRMVSIASNWAGDAGREDGAKTDKIPLKDRYEWAVNNEEMLLSFAEDPKNNQGWMEADKPWQLLAGCLDLYRMREWQCQEGKDFTDYSYETSLEVFIDGTNNGSQHLSALTLDEVTAPLVNLVSLDLPGDLYKYIAEHVWSRLRDKVHGLGLSTTLAANHAIDSLIEYKRLINKADPGTEERKYLVESLREFKDNHADILDETPPLYWYRITDAKHKRKIVKRGVMTLPYGGTAYGLGQQVIDDSKKHGIDLLLYMEHKWGAFMGREIYDTCKEALKRPMQLLSVFENAGKRAEKEDRFLSWNVPITNFPVTQHYVEGKVKKTWIQYGPPKGPRKSTGYFENTYQLHICYVEDLIPSKGKQAQGASPNCIHSLDAAHLMITVWNCDFPVTTVHDSFGCLPADMPKLYRILRESFVELYRADPLKSLMVDIGGDLTNIQFGNLDINLILESEYCFS